VQLPHLSHVWLDAGYNGKDKGQEWIEKELGWTTEVIRPPSRRVIVAADVEPAPRPAFTVLPRRWVVERSLQPQKVWEKNKGESAAITKRLLANQKRMWFAKIE